MDATFRAAQRYLVLLVAPLAAAMVALPTQGIFISVGRDYLESASALRWLAAWAFITTLAIPIHARAMGEGNTRVLLLVTLLNAGLNVLLNGLLVPKALLGLGATGASLATFVAACIAYAYLRRWSHQAHGIELWGVRLWRVLLAAGVTSLSFWAAGELAPARWLDHAWELLAVGVAGLGLYVALLAALRELTREDAHVLARLLHPSSWVPKRDAP